MAANSWRNPSAAIQAKFHLAPVPDGIEPTEEEQALFDMYATVKNFERHAARLKEQKAREKLEARDAEFKQSRARKRNGRRAKKADSAGDDNDDGDGDESPVQENSDDEDSDGEDEKRTIQERRAEKLEKLRNEVETKQQAMMEEEMKEENMREQLLAANDDVDSGLTLRKKRPRDEEEGDLLTSMMKTQTPPHDFSKKLGFTPLKGKVLFPTVPGETRWTPPESPSSPNDGAFLVELENFDILQASNGKGNNTLAIKFSAPADSKRFSINIGGPDHNDFDSVLMHFNPRQFERGGQLVINDKQTGIWGQAINLPLSQVPIIFGQTSITLQIQINGDGFDIFIEDKHCARLEHRKELPSKPCSLFLQFPSSDDYRSPENWIVYKTWWGNKAIMTKADLAGVPGVNNFNAIHPRKLFVSGLSKIHSDSEVEIRRAELERAFRKYGGARGVTCIVPKNSTFAFVEMENERMADLALAEMAGKFKLNRARWSKHEALQEKRASEDAAKQGKTKESTTW